MAENQFGMNPKTGRYSPEAMKHMTSKSNKGYSEVKKKKEGMASKMIDNVGANSHKKDTIKGVGRMKNSNRSMP